MTTLALFDKNTGTRPGSIDVNITPSLCVFLRNNGLIIESATPKEK